MKKRILSVLITLVMLISLVTVMSVSASAATTYSVGLYNWGGYQYEGGSAIAQYQADKSSASEGDTVTIYMRSLNTGWTVDTVTVTNKSTEQEVAVTDIGGNKYTFTMPASEVSVRVKCVRAPLDVISNTTENGTYTVPAKVSPQTTATIYANPANGYSVDTVTVTGNTSGNSVDVSYIGNDSYTFKMPDESVTVNVTFGDLRYHVWVGGTQITAANASDVFGDGTVKFTPSDGANAATLTLNGYTFNNGTIDTDAVIFTEYEDLSILLVGENSITTDKAGINAINCALTIADDTSDSDIGKLSITAEDEGIYCSKGDSWGTLNIEGVELNIESTSWAGIYTYEADAYIESATITIKAKSDALYVRGVYYFGITDSTVNANGDENGIDLSYTNEMVITNSNVSAAGDQAIYAFGTEISIYRSVLEATGTNNAIALSSETGAEYFHVNSAHYVLAGSSKDTADYVNPTNLKNYSKKYVKIVNRDPKNLSVTREGVTEYFDSLENVWDYLKDGDVIKVEHDYIETYADVYAELYDSISYTIDLNGNEIHFPEYGYWQDAYWTDVGCFQPSGILTLTDSVGGGFMHAMVDARYADSLAVTGGTYVALFAPTDTKLSGGTFTGMPQEAVDAMMEDPYQAQFAKMIGTKGVLHNSFFDDDINSDEEAAVAAFNEIFADNYVGNKGYGVYETQSGYYLVYLPANSTILEAYNVTLNYGVGDEESNLAIVSEFTEPVPRRISGKIFIGWYDDAGLTALHDFSTGLTKDITLYAKFADYEDDKAELNDAIDALETTVGNVETALNNKVSTDKLTEEVGKLNQAIADAKTYADTQDAALKTTLEAADATMNAAITELQNRVTALETGLTTANGNINTNTRDITALKNDVSDLKTWKDNAQDAIEALETLTATQGTNISALQTAVADLQTAVNTANDKITAAENRIAVLEGKVTDLEMTTANLQNAVTALQAAVAGKADATEVEAKFEELDNAIENAKETAKNYTDGKVTDLTNAIEAAKQAAIDASKDYTDSVREALITLINAKASASEINAKIGELATAIARAEEAAKAYTDGKVTELTDAIEAAKQAAIEASKGYIPYIGTNGNWWIGDTDTGVDANGIKGDKGDTGATGAPGAQGPKGEKGDTGAQGADGVGIANIEKTSSDGNVDTYTITLTNGTTYTFTVTNGTNGTDGKDGVDGKDGINGTNGVDGKDGANGTDGQTPYIGENGNWWIGDTDTGVKAAGDDGKDGAIIAVTSVGGTALISNIALIAWTLIKKKRLF